MPENRPLAPEQILCGSSRAALEDEVGAAPDRERPGRSITLGHKCCTGASARSWAGASGDESLKSRWRRSNNDAEHPGVSEVTFIPEVEAQNVQIRRGQNLHVCQRSEEFFSRQPFEMHSCATPADHGERMLSGSATT